MFVEIFSSSPPLHRLPLHIFEMTCNVSAKVSSRKAVKGFWRQTRHVHRRVSVVRPVFLAVLLQKDIVNTLVARSLTHRIAWHALLIPGVRYHSPTLRHPHPSPIIIKRLPPKVLRAPFPSPLLPHHLPLEFQPMFWNLPTRIVVHHSEHRWRAAAVLFMGRMFHHHLHTHSSNRKALTWRLGAPLAELLVAGTPRYSPKGGPLIITSWILPMF